MKQVKEGIKHRQEIIRKGKKWGNWKQADLRRTKNASCVFYDANLSWRGEEKEGKSKKLKNENKNNQA